MLTESPQTTRSGLSWPVIAIPLLVLSLAIRLAAMRHWGIGPIENEGAEYARMAENLRNGVGLVGIASPGKQLLFNPLYPLLISGVSFLTNDCERAARLISLFTGTLLPLVALGIGTRLFGRCAGITAALLTATFPLLVNLSFTAYSEGNYATVLFFAFYLVLRALKHGSLRIWLLVGAVFGLAYLLRAESTAPLLIAALFAFTMPADKPALRYKRAAAAICGYLVLALPQVIVLYRSTGKLLFEGKSSIFYALGVRTLPPANFSVARNYEDVLNRASYEVQPDLTRTGVFMRPAADVIREVRIDPRKLARIIAIGVRHNGPTFFHRLSSDWFGAPFLPALALLGAMRRPWRRPQLAGRLFFLFVMATPILATFTFFWNEPRFYFVLVAFFLIWASNGLIEMRRWTLATLAPLWPGRPIVPRLSWVIPGAFALATIIFPIKGVRALDTFTDSAPSNRVEKDIGLLLRNQQNYPVHILDIPLILSYHAGAEHVYFPYCDAQTAVRFLDSAQIDYVVLRRDLKFTPYYDDWLDHGIPDPRAERLDLSSVSNFGKFVIFRWHRK